MEFVAPTVSKSQPRCCKISPVHDQDKHFFLHLAFWLSKKRGRKKGGGIKYIPSTQFFYNTKRSLDRNSLERGYFYVLECKCTTYILQHFSTCKFERKSLHILPLPVLILQTCIKFAIGLKRLNMQAQIKKYMRDQVVLLPK